jgi:NitT/TauT family transport system substrate-binding protein
MPTYRLSFVSALMSLVLLGAAVAPLAAQEPLTHVTVVSSPSDSGGEVYYAKERGTFAKYGLDVEIINLTAGAAVTAALASGRYDIGQSNVATIAAAREIGLPFVLVAPGSLYTSKAPTAAVLVPKDSPIKTAADLAGKSVANPAIRDIGTIGLDMWLMSQNVDPASVRVVEMPQAVSTDAIVRGTVDAGVIIEPFYSIAVAAGAVRVLAFHYDAIAPRFMIGAYFARGDWVQAHPAAAKAFAAAIAETAKWANANHAASAQILSSSLHVTVSPTQTRVAYAEALDPAVIQPLLDAAVKTKLMKAPIAAATLLQP